jgi:hypothetical protein
MNQHLFSLSLATLLLWSGSCRKSEPVQVRPPGMVDSEGKAIQPKPVQPAAPEPAPTPEAPTVYDFERPSRPDPGALSAPLPPTGLSAKATLGVPTELDAGAPQRDLNAELSAALAPASSCVDVMKAAAQPDGRLTISVTAHVLGTGHVSRATVTAPGQPASVLACVEKQVLALSLPGPILDAPLQVMGSTQLQIKAAGGANPSTPSPSVNPIKPQATNPNIARPVPGDVAGPP